MPTTLAPTTSNELSISPLIDLLQKSDTDVSQIPKQIASSLEALIPFQKDEGITKVLNEAATSANLPEKQLSLAPLTCLFQKGKEINIAELSDVLAQLDKSDPKVKAIVTDALCICAKRGSYSAIELLLSYGADLHADSNAALRVSCHQGFTDIVELLIYRGADLTAGDQMPLMLAITGGQAETVDLLLKSGADINARGGIVLGLSINEGFAEVAEVLIAHGADMANIDKERFLVNACIHGFDDVVYFLIEYRADVNWNHGRPLSAAAYNGHITVVRTLIAAGAVASASDNFAILMAAHSGHYDIVELLLKYIEEINTTNDIALIIAAHKGYARIVQLLLKNLADVHAMEDLALLLAIKYYRRNTLKVLMAHGADLHARKDLPLRLILENLGPRCHCPADLLSQDPRNPTGSRPRSAPAKPTK